ncbi:hypothetical protein K1719_020638 [Acacia pycnantha]|nr:hypothetical protein K1719_020638 [Acacia pycnantha]
MQHHVPFDFGLKNEPPPHPGEDQSSKRAKLDETPQLIDNMEDDIPVESPPIITPASCTSDECVPETPLPPPEQDTPMGEDIPTTNPKALSFKDKLLNSDSKPPEEEEPDFVRHQGDVAIGLNGNIPTVDFASHVQEALNQRMGLAVVVKLLGRKINYRFLRPQLQNLWKPSGQIKIIDLHDDCFLVRFEDDMDYQNALLNGWIRLPIFPARYYHKNIIQSIGSVFGDVIHVDYNTDSGDRGKFARLAVNIDLSKPLTSKIRVQRRPRRTYDRGGKKGVPSGDSGVATTSRYNVLADVAQLEDERQLVYAPLNGNTTPHAEFSFQRKKGKETKGPLRTEPSIGKHQSITRTSNQDNIFNSHYYASQVAATSLDTNHHSTILIADSRLPHRH